MLFLRSVFLSFLLILSGLASGQYCVWLNTYDSSLGEAIHVDDSNYVLQAGALTGSVNMGGNSLTSGYLENSYVLKTDTAGKVIWAMQTVAIGTTGSQQCRINDIVSDRFGNYYVAGSLVGQVNFGNSVTLSAPTGQPMRFLLKLNNIGQPQWVVDFTASVSIGHAVIATDPSGNVCISMPYAGQIFHSGITGFGSQGGQLSDIALYKFNTNGTLVWSTSVGGFGIQTMYRSMTLDSLGFIYIGGFNRDNWLFGNTWIADTGFMLLKFAPNGNPLKGRVFKANGGGGGMVQAFADGRVAMVGYAFDTLDFGPGKKVINPNSSGQVGYLALMDSSLNCMWSLQQVISNQSQMTFLNAPAIRKDYLFVGGYVSGGTSKWGGFDIQVPSGITQAAMMSKVDTLGNVLWCFVSSCSSCNLSVRDVGADDHGAGYFTGYWNDTIQVFNQQQTGNNDYNQFTAKISNYAIERGNVYQGPYCAGDTILVPYSKAGDYESSNQFIAELSDSAGNFESGYRELGRLTSDTSGVIKGVLPLFNVATSADYRIRVISTSPQVQSYYLKDTLRLLIFSKDTANAGPDRTICSGEQTYLSTSGGSKWEWSPIAGLIDPADSNERSVLISPAQTTDYRIIISDSTGCGLTDTDYVQIRVRPPLQVQVPTQVNYCRQRLAHVPATVSGGDSANYHYQWWWDSDPNKQILSTDSVFSYAPFSTRRYWVKVTDSCSLLSDSASVLIRPQSGVDLFNISDTTICSGQSVAVQVRYDACDTSAVKLYWNHGLGVGNTQVLSPQFTTDYEVIGIDTVDGSTDTSRFRITVRPPIQFDLGMDTLLCRGQYMMLNPTISGGLNAYRFQWQKDTGAGYFDLDTQTQIQHYADRVAHLKLTLKDGCSPESSDSIFIDVRDPLLLKITPDTTVCFKEQVRLWAQTGGGKMSNHQVSWYDADWNELDTGKWLDLVPVKSRAIYAVLRDQCTSLADSGSLQLHVRDPLRISPIADTVLCDGAGFMLEPNASGGSPSGYLFYLRNQMTAHLDSGLNFVIQPDDSTRFTLSLEDGCSGEGASLDFTVSFLPELRIKLSAQDSICGEMPLYLSSQYSGGISNQYQLTWLRNDSLRNWSQWDPTDYPSASSKYKVELNDGCSSPAADSIWVTVLPLPTADFMISDSIGCQPLELGLIDQSTEHDPLRNVWKLGGQSFESGDLQLILDRPGVYGISLTVFNALNCSQELLKKQAVEVLPKPIASFTMRPEAIQTDEKVKLEHDGSAAQVIDWYTGDGRSYLDGGDSITHIFQDSGWYNVRQIVWNADGCSDTLDCMTRVVLSPFCAIPNAFTPNNNNLNEVFSPACSGIESYTMTITNRWGEIIYSGENGSWDGTYLGQPVPDGVYFYRIDIRTAKRERSYAVGPVQVLR